MWIQFLRADIRIANFVDSVHISHIHVACHVHLALVGKHSCCLSRTVWLCGHAILLPLISGCPLLLLTKERSNTQAMDKIIQCLNAPT